MNTLTLVLLVDAFRRDYLARTAFLRSLAARSRVGAFREDFGFLPRAAYFGGLTPSESGFTNMYCYDPAASPFGVARGLPRNFGPAIERTFGTRAWIDAEARKRTTPYAATYLSSGAIPLALLPGFDVVEKFAPWDRRVGYRSIFHELEDLDRPFFHCAWPDTNTLADGSDAGIVARTLDDVRPPCRFAFVHLQELDGIGHAFGPESRELAEALDRTDGRVSSLLTTLESRFDRVNIVLFGDHGMVSVTRTVDVWAAIEAAGIRIGQDVIPFLDSTMARFWFPTNVARARLIECLDRLPGTVVEGDELERLDLAGCDPRNGELTFLAKPGVVISPNFFQAAGHVPLGMHGYDPDCPDNQGLFLVYEPGAPAGAIETVRAAAVYTESRRLTGLGHGESALDATMPERIEGRFTQHPDKSAHAMLAAHMDRIVGEARAAVPQLSTVILGGSFGRDEGGVMRDEFGAMRPVNDYDVLLVAPRAPGATPDVEPALRTLGCRLARGFGIDFVHFVLADHLDPNAPPTITNFDLRHGGRVLWGDPDALRTLPRYAAADIPLFEGLQLLCNRLAGLLSGVRWHEGASGPEPAERRYLLNQTMKALMALGDWRLVRARAYDASYAARLTRFTWLADSFSVAPDQRDAILEAYRFKIRPDCVRVRDLAARATRAQRWLLGAAMDAMGAISHRAVATPLDAASTYCQVLTADATTVAADNAYAARALANDSLVTVRPSPAGWVRQAIYASMPLVAAAADGDRDAFADAGARLDACLTPPWPEELTPANWELVRHRLTHAWLTLVH